MLCCHNTYRSYSNLIEETFQVQYEWAQTKESIRTCCMKCSQNKPWCYRSCTVWHRLHKARPLGSCTQRSINKYKLAGDGTSAESASLRSHWSSPCDAGTRPDGGAAPAAPRADRPAAPRRPIIPEVKLPPGTGRTGQGGGKLGGRTPSRDPRLEGNGRSLSALLASEFGHRRHLHDCSTLSNQ